MDHVKTRHRFWLIRPWAFSAEMNWAGEWYIAIGPFFWIFEWEQVPEWWGNLVNFATQPDWLYWPARRNESRRAGK